MARSDYVVVENLRELNAAVKKSAGAAGTTALRRAGIKAVSAVVVEARREAPHGATGRLERSIKGGATARSAFVQAGTRTAVPYAGPQNYGWPGSSMRRALAHSRSRMWRRIASKPVRGITGRHFLDGAVRKESPFILAAYETSVREALSPIDMR